MGLLHAAGAKAWICGEAVVQAGLALCALGAAQLRACQGVVLRPSTPWPSSHAPSGCQGVVLRPSTPWPSSHAPSGCQGVVLRHSSTPWPSSHAPSGCPTGRGRAWTGKLPAAVSPDSMTQSVPSSTALATSVASARVGRGFLIMLSSIWVAVMTGLPACRARLLHTGLTRRMPETACTAQPRHHGMLLQQAAISAALVGPAAWDHAIHTVCTALRPSTKPRFTACSFHHPGCHDRAATSMLAGHGRGLTSCRIARASASCHCQPSPMRSAATAYNFAPLDHHVPGTYL